MAVRGHGVRLVLLSPYTSIPDMARRITPFLPVSLIVGDRFDTAAKASALELPVLVVHGEDDEVIPFEMGRELSLRLPRARLVKVEGGRHGDLFYVHGERVFGEIARFCNEP